MAEGNETAELRSNNAAEALDVDATQRKPIVDGGGGSASVKLSSKDLELEKKLKQRTMSDPSRDRVTGAELGAGQGVAD